MRLVFSYIIFILRNLEDVTLLLLLLLCDLISLQWRSVRDSLSSSFPKRTRRKLRRWWDRALQIWNVVVYSWTVAWIIWFHWCILHSLLKVSWCSCNLFNSQKHRQEVYQTLAQSLSDTKRRRRKFQTLFPCNRPNRQKGSSFEW